MASLSKQELRDFECVVVDDCSTDETLAEIDRFLSSGEYSAASFPIRVYKNPASLGGVRNWNSPLMHASGKYIAGLEGDDYYHPDHLKRAYSALATSPNTGVYATGSQRGSRPRKGLILSEDFFRYLYQVINVSPPSETIFIRLNRNGERFMYDVENNTYAPEIQLMLSIADDGWDAFHSFGSEVYREPSSSQTNMTWKFFRDKFELMKKFRNHRLINDQQFRESFRRQFILSVRRYLVSDHQKKGDPLSIKEGLEGILKDQGLSGIAFYSFLFRIILILKAMGIFRIYFSLKGQN